MAVAAVALDETGAVERTGGDDNGDIAPDSTPRRWLAYVLVRVAFFLLRSGLRQLSPEHPFRVISESILETKFSVFRRLPRFGIVPLESSGMTRATKRLWGAAFAFALALVVSDAFSVGPVDLGMIPDVHVFDGLLDALGVHLPWCSDVHPNAFGIDLPWHRLYPHTPAP